MPEVKRYLMSGIAMNTLAWYGNKDVHQFRIFFEQGTAAVLDEVEFKPEPKRVISHKLTEWGVHTIFNYDRGIFFFHGGKNYCHNEFTVRTLTWMECLVLEASGNQITMFPEFAVVVGNEVEL